jgi:hypothetical protein
MMKNALQVYEVSLVFTVETKDADSAWDLVNSFASDLRNAREENGQKAVISVFTTEPVSSNDVEAY